MGLKPRARPQIETIPLAGLRACLPSLGLSRAARALIEGAEIDPVLAPGDDAWNAQFTAVWVRGRWSPASDAPLLAAGSHPTVAVFEDALRAPDAPVVLGYEALLGVERQADQAALVFLGPVHCRDVCTVADSTVVFAAGLTVERLACFAGPRTHTHIDGHLRARFVLSESAYLGDDVALEVGALCGHLGGARRRGLQTVSEPATLLPELAGAADHDSVARLITTGVWAGAGSREP